MATYSVSYLYALKDMVSARAAIMAKSLRGVRRQAMSAGKAVTALGAIGVLGATAGITSGIRAYAEFEQHLLQVKKVVPGTIKDFGAIEQAIRQTAVAVPMSRENIAMFFEEGIRASVADARKGTQAYAAELKDFATLSAQTAFLFNMSARQTAPVLAKMKSSLGLSMSDMRQYLGQINLLGDTMATTEADILDVVRRVGANIQSLGVGNQQIIRKQRANVAAVAAALTAAGVKREVAATGMRNLLLRAGLGNRAVKEVRDGFRLIGIHPSEFARLMGKDYFGAVRKLMGAIAKIQDVEKRNAVLKKILGMRAVDAFSPVFANYKALFAQAKELSDDIKRQEARWTAGLKAKYQGILAQMRRTGNSLQNLRDLMVVGWADEMVWLMEKIRQISEYLQNNPGLAKWVSGFLGIALAAGAVLVTVGLIAMAVSALIPLFTAVGAAVTLMSGPIGWAIAALVVGGILVYKYWDQIKAAFHAVNEAAASVVVPAFMGDFETSGKNLVGIFQRVRQAILDMLPDSVRQKIEAFNAWLNAKLAGLVDAVDFSGMWDGLTAGLDAARQKIASFFGWLQAKWAWVKSIPGLGSWLSVRSNAKASVAAVQSALSGVRDAPPAQSPASQVVQSQAQALTVRSQVSLEQHMQVTAPPAVQLKLPSGLLAGKLPLDAKLPRGTNMATSEAAPAQ